MRRLKGISDWINLARSAGFQCRNLARLCGTSPAYLNQFFVSQFHRPPQEWLDELRMWEAFRLLCENRSVKETAYTLGFKQISHFSRVFTQYHGFCPSQCAEVYQLTCQMYFRNLAHKFPEEADVELVALTRPWIKAEMALSLQLQTRARLSAQPVG